MYFTQLNNKKEYQTKKHKEKIQQERPCRDKQMIVYIDKK